MELHARLTGVDASPNPVRARLARLLRPKTIAFVGLSDNRVAFLDTIAPTFDSDAEIFVVNPNYPTVLDRPTVPTLSALDRPVDAVMSFLSAERTTQLVEEAAGLDVGGVVLVAAGFAELDSGGEALQERIKAAAAATSMPVIGPNGLGFVNVPAKVSLTIAAPHKRRAGGISVVSQSGAMLSGIAMAAWDYDRVGTNILVSAGNEAITDLADYVDFLAEDDDTKAIALVIEQIRRPAEFFAAVARATEAGKPVAALKLARNERSQRMAASHTGALTGDAWVYDVALQQAGVALAYDPEELIDRLALADQLPRRRWTPVSSLGVLTVSGGFASLSLDLALGHGLNVPPLDGYKEWVSTSMPGITVPNPLDATGVGARIWPEIVDKYVTDPELDAILVIHLMADEDGDRGHISRTLVQEFAKSAQKVDKPCVVANCSGTPAPWVRELLGDSLVFGRGVRSSLRGLATLGAFVRYRDGRRQAPPSGPEIARPASTPIPQPEGLMLPFVDTMALLAEHGIPVAPCHMVAADADPSGVRPPFAGPYVVKLADVAHRTEHDAVRLKVDDAGLPDAIGGLRKIAAADGLSPLVVVQPMLEITGETLLGIQASSELGPLVVFGLGGIFVEALNKIGGRMAPFDAHEARALIEEFTGVKVMHGFRGQPPWDLEALSELLVAAGRLAANGRKWISTLDVNPLVYGPTGFHAVDALLLVRPG
ncbi:MAG TPA: acetate--CoA ligase family protein [Acidimicrobiales bacterium]